MLLLFNHTQRSLDSQDLLFLIGGGDLTLGEHLDKDAHGDDETVDVYELRL